MHASYSPIGVIYILSLHVTDIMWFDKQILGPLFITKEMSTRMPATGLATVNENLNLDRFLVPCNGVRSHVLLEMNELLDNFQAFENSSIHLSNSFENSGAQK